MKRFRPGLTVSILAFVSCLLLSAWLLFSFLAFKTAANDLYAQKGDHARLLLTTFISQLPESLPTYPTGIIAPDSPAAVYIGKLSDDAAFTRLTLLDVNDKVVYTVGRDAAEIYLPFEGKNPLGQGVFVLDGERGIACVAPAIRGGLAVGKAGLLLSLDAEKQRLKRSRQLFAAYFAIDFFLLVGCGAYVLSRIVVLPVNRLLAATEKITGGQYGHTVKIAGCSELARLAESFNHMSLTLQGKDRQVSEHVAALERANIELHRAREEAVRTEKMASIGLLAAGMAHEIGTPLATIMGYAEMLGSERSDNPAVQDFSRRISQESARIDRIVRGLLDYARPRRNTSGVCRIGELLETSLDLLRQQGVFKNIQVGLTCADRLDPVLADPHQLQQVLINLMLNGRDAMTDGGRLELACANVPPPAFISSVRCVRIDVADSGTGIDPDKIDKIFDPFFTTKEPGKGTGLGLAISARIIESFGGRITVTSEPGRGSCFTVWLPSLDGQKEDV